MNVLNEVEFMLQNGNAPQALDLLGSLNREDRTLRYAELLAAVLVQLRQYEQAAKVGKEAFAAGLESERLHDLVAESLVQVGLLHEAQVQASKGSGGPDALVQQAWTALSLDRHTVAEALAIQAVEKSPTLSSANGVLWGVRALRGQTVAFDRLLDLWWIDRSPVVFNVLVLVSERLGRLDEIDAIIADIRKRPKEDTQLFYWIARYYVKRGDCKEALQALDQAPERIRGLPRMDLLRGMAMCEQARFREALPLLRRAFEDQPAGGDECHYYLRALLRTGRMAQALSIFVSGIRSKMKLLPLVSSRKTIE